MSQQEYGQWIGLKWIVKPVTIKGLPIFNYTLYYHNLLVTDMYTNDEINGTWKMIYNVEDTGKILR